MYYTILIKKYNEEVWKVHQLFTEKKDAVEMLQWARDWGGYKDVSLKAHRKPLHHQLPSGEGCRFSDGTIAVYP